MTVLPFIRLAAPPVIAMRQPTSLWELKAPSPNVQRLCAPGGRSDGTPFFEK